MIWMWGDSGNLSKTVLIIYIWQIAVTNLILGLIGVIMPEIFFRDEHFPRENNYNTILRLFHNFFKGLEGLRYKRFLQILKEIVKHHQNSVINIFPGIFCREKKSDE